MTLKRTLQARQVVKCRPGAVCPLRIITITRNIVSRRTCQPRSAPQRLHLGPSQQRRHPQGHRHQKNGVCPSRHSQWRARPLLLPPLSPPLHRRLRPSKRRSWTYQTTAPSSSSTRTMTRFLRWSISGRKVWADRSTSTRGRAGSRGVMNRMRMCATRGRWGARLHRTGATPHRRSRPQILG